MKKFRIKKVLPLVLAVMLAAALLGACAPGDADAPADGDDPIRVALVGALTGPFTQYGEGKLNAAQVAVNQWNERGGINGREIVISAFDERGQVEEGLAVAQLVMDAGHYFGVVGHFMSINVVGGPYTEERMTMIAPTASSPHFSAQGDTIFRLNATLRTETEAMLLCADFIGRTRLGVVHLDDDWGTEGYRIVREILSESNPLGYEIVAVEAILGGDMDYTPVLTNLREAGVEIAIMFCYYDSVVPFALMASTQFPELYIVTNSSCYNENFIEVGGSAVEGVLVPGVFYANDPDPEVQAFVSGYAQLTGGRTPSGLSAQAFDAMHVLLEAIYAVNGELDREGIRNAVQNNTRYGVTGPNHFDANGDAVRLFMPLIVRGGQWVPYVG